MEQLNQTVINTLALRILNLEEYATQLVRENEQLKQQLAEATTKEDNIVDFPQQ